MSPTVTHNPFLSQVGYFSTMNSLLFTQWQSQRLICSKNLFDRKNGTFCGKQQQAVGSAYFRCCLSHSTLFRSTLDCKQNHCITLITNHMRHKSVFAMIRKACFTVSIIMGRTWLGSGSICCSTQLSEDRLFGACRWFIADVFRRT